MKTRAFIIMLAMMLTAGILKTSAQGLSLGAKAGIGIPYFTHFDLMDDDLKRTPGIMAQGGFILNYKFNSLIGIQAELLYQQKGEKIKGYINDLEEDVETRILLNYLTLPVLVQVSHSFNNFNLFGGFGPYIGYALNGKIIETQPEKVENKLQFGKNNFRRIDFGLSFDLGCGYKVGPGNLFLDLRYDLGFLDVFYITGSPEGYKKRCPRSADITVGYLIPIGKK